MPEAKTVLLVDDDRDLVESSRLRLRAAGFETVVAYDGEEGLEQAAQHHCDAIVLDVRMPRMDGLTALSELREREATRRTPIVMLSASLSDQRAALDAGARFFIRKPHTGPNLVAALRTAIDEQHAINRRLGIPHGQETT